MNPISRLLVTAALACTAACGGLSDVGKQDTATTPPVADVVVLNQPFTKDAAGKVTARVRSGTEVFLSGKDSDGVVAPVLTYDWRLLTTTGVAAGLPLIVRNENTRSFTAPAVTQDTVLQFRLIVTDSNGKTDQKDVDITVVGIPDAGHFLSYNLDDLRKVKLTAIASRAVASGELTSDTGFEISVKRLVDYTTPGVDGPYLEVGSEVLTGKWLAGYGIGASCADVQNPTFQIPLPALDVDDILAKIDVRNAALEPNPALIDSFNVKLQITIRQVAGAGATGTLPSGVTPYVCAERVAPPVSSAVIAKVAPAATTQVSVSAKGRSGPRLQFAQTEPTSGLLEMSLDELMGAADATADTRESAAAYYDTIDPGAQRTTFLDWLKVNGFLAGSNPTLSWSTLQANSHTHAVYTNNFDLGFGRDMYARIVKCDGTVPALGQPIAETSIGTCDIAAVVVNYTSLEGASKKVNPVLAVAMEYSKPAGADRRIVQFYTYAPDSVAGDFMRVSSANLDGRGEKYMPQVCTSCHGGTPGGVTAQGVYHNAGDAGAFGDVNATFLPWDLDSFLFSDTEGSNADRSYADSSTRAFYTRATQAESLRKLNQLAYLTYRDPSRPNRFVLPRQLLEGWYGVQGGNAFTSTTFNGQYTPPGWTANGIDGQPGGGDDNPADAPTIYHDVFARNCRACHIAHLPTAAASGAHLNVFTDTRTFNTCDETLTPAAGGLGSEPQRIGVAHQVPMGCYRQFLNAPALAQRVSAGTMPFARLTMDRLWTGSSGATNSAGALLRTHLGANMGGVVPDAPGTPFARISVNPSAADVGEWVSLVLAADSRFVDAPRWSVCKQSGGMCTAVSVVAADSAEGRFKVPSPGSFQATLNFGAGGSVQQTLTVADTAPGLSGLPTEVGVGLPLTIASSVVTGGNGAEADHVWWLTGLENLVYAAGATQCTAQNPCRLGTLPQLQLVSTLTAIDTVTPANNRGRFTLHVRDLDVSEAAVTQDVEVKGTLTVGSFTGRVAANASDAIVVDDSNSAQFDLRQGNSAQAGETLAIEIENCSTGSNCATSGQNVRGQVGRARVDGILLRYTPPATYATHPPTGTVRARPADTLRYRLVRRNGATVVEQSSWATVSLRVRAPVSFETNVVNGILKRTTGTWASGLSTYCETCHKPGAGYGAFTNDPNTTSLRYDWTADEIYQRVGPDANGHSLESKQMPGVNYVDLATSDPVGNSALYQYPTEATAGHSGGDRNPPACGLGPPCDDLADLKRWIESGANRF